MTGEARLPWRMVIGFAAGGFAQSVLPLVVSVYAFYYYSPPATEGLVLLSPAIVGAIRMIVGVVNAAFEPAVGHFSDRTRTRFGRRRPFMALGLPVLLLGFMLVWVPHRGAGLDAVSTQAHLLLSLMLFFSAYTFVFGPYNALLPEMTPDEGQRMRLSVWMSLFEVIAQVFGTLGASYFIALGAIRLFGLELHDGHQLLAIVCVVLSAVSVSTAIFAAKESPPPAEESPPGFFVSAKTALSSAGFRRYAAVMFSFRLASAAAVVAIPYLGTQLMGLEESQAGALVGVIVVVATLAFPLVQWLSGRSGRSRIFRYGGYGFVVVLPLMGTIGLVPGLSPLVHGCLLFVAAGFSVATLFVIPRTLLADIIDADARSSGQRKEALYTGMSGVVEKLGEAGASGVVGVLFTMFGNSQQSPLGLRLLGVVAAAVLGVGLFFFRKHGER